MDSLHRVVIGYDEGTIMVKLGREVPVASMDNSGKIIWAKHNEIQTVNIKSVGADYEVHICLVIRIYYLKMEVLILQCSGN